jgi:insertion element IS1 protein InsB
MSHLVDLLAARAESTKPEGVPRVVVVDNFTTGWKTRLSHLASHPGVEIRDTVLRELKKKEPVLESINTAVLKTLNPDKVTVDIERAGEAEMDEMWSFVRRKSNPRWLWHAIDHSTGAVLAYVFGRRKDKVFLKLKELLDPFGLTHYYTDKWGAYTRHLDPEQHTTSKRYTQKIERKYLTLRTRIHIPSD